MSDLENELKALPVEAEAKIRTELNRLEDAILTHKMLIGVVGFVFSLLGFMLGHTVK
jgi:hypothetical protein